MGQRYYNYKITDTLANKVILNNASPQDVSDKIGITKANICTYIANGNRYKRRYKIERIEFDRDEKKKYTSDEKQLMDEWDRVRFILNPRARR